MTVATVATAPDPPAAFTGVQTKELVHSFYFARAVYPSGNGRFGRGGSAYTDWPDADRVIITVLGRLTNVDVQTEPFAITLDDPNLSSLSLPLRGRGGLDWLCATGI